jgi:hypothetical protein
VDSEARKLKFFNLKKEIERLISKADPTAFTQIDVKKNVFISRMPKDKDAPKKRL